MSQAENIAIPSKRKQVLIGDVEKKKSKQQSDPGVLHGSHFQRKYVHKFAPQLLCSWGYLEPVQPERKEEKKQNRVVRYRILKPLPSVEEFDERGSEEYQEFQDTRVVGKLEVTQSN